MLTRARSTEIDLTDATLLYRGERATLFGLKNGQLLTLLSGVLATTGCKKPCTASEYLTDKNDPQEASVFESILLDTTPPSAIFVAYFPKSKRWYTTDPIRVLAGTVPNDTNASLRDRPSTPITAHNERTQP